MKIHVDQASRVSLSNSAQKFVQALALLKAEVDKEKGEQLKALAEVFQAHTPVSYLVSDSARQIADWLKKFLYFIESRRKDAAVCIYPFGKKGSAFLLVNAPDTPYLLDSIQTFLEKQALRFHIVSHPILTIQRKKGVVTLLYGMEGEGQRESFIVIELEDITEKTGSLLEQGVMEVIQAVMQVRRDHKDLMQKFKMLEQAAGTENYRDFWRWLQNGNFFPFSYRCLRVRKGQGGKMMVQDAEGASLGIRVGQDIPCCEERPLTNFEQSFQDRILRKGQVVVEKIDHISPIYRAERLVYLGFRESGEADSWQEHIFLGLFSRKSTDELTSNIPPLRRRIKSALEALCVPRSCYDYRKTIEIFDTFPKVELFFMDPDELIQTVRFFALSYRRGAIKVVAASSLAVRGLTLLVIMPREFYTSENMARIETYLCRYFKSPSATSRIIHFSSDYLSLHVHVNPQAEEIDLDPERLEQGLTNIARPWEIKLQIQLERAYGEKCAAELWHKYGGAFSREYRTFIHPRFALQDIKRLEKVLATGEEVLDLWGPFRREEPFYRLQFYSLRQSYLNELMPLLENLNLCVIDEIDFALKIVDKEVFIKSFAVRSTAAGARKLSPLRGILLDALAALRNGEAENDYLNRLLVLTGLSWREIDIFRGYRNYYFQLGSHFTKRRVAFALINNPQVAGLLFRYFEARFRPEPKWETFLQREEESLSPVRQELVAALQAVTDINEDRILRTLFNLIDSTVRTNFFLRKNRADYFFSFKISAIGIIDMPVPRPLFETYVHCSTMEGIHLRGGAVARGGIRWSDRPDDFRTEILGLMKTQMTKNAVIVPVGSKGGFVVKTPYAEREQGAILAKEAYKTLMRGMLDLTDNRIADKVVRPQGIVAHDDDDPYLVVAADKGTAHLSDTANAISKEYNFWLGDAFASGGSQGYDHKKLGITARGAWECVKRHFREMDIDIQTQSFTVVGIGDMSGDVFGNGMLLSPQIRLLAAFDHRHIFFDPDPDPAVSFKERQRLFALPRSSWDDYNRSLISEGGGVFPRAAKDIPLSPEVRSWLCTRHESMDGPSLIRLILAAEVDLLWNGGIGTYVKASSERNEEVGDRANDTVRIDASQLKARVVGEGGNLGFTQKARIEYALAGGRINTDAVDNSAGVDCSDHEVNLKILMRHLREKEALSSLVERDRLLQEVTDEVSRKVLADNYNQSLCLSLDLARCAEDVEPFLELAERLTGAGLLNRSGESLPSAKEVLARKDGKFTRPELAILMAYSKMQLYQNLLESDLPERKGVRNFLTCYFPEAIRERFAEHLTDHPLAREITATVFTNTVVNQAGSAFIDQLVRKTGALPAEIMATYLAFNEILDGENLRGQLHALDNRIPSKQQYLFLHRLEDALGVLCIWALEHEMKIQPEDQAIVSYREMVLTFVKILGGILPEMEWEKCKTCAVSLEEKGLSADLARRFSTLSYMEDFLPLVTLVSKTGGDLYSVARTFNEVRNYLGLKEILRLLDAVQVRDRWDRMTYQALKEGFASAAFSLTLVILQESEGNLEAFFAGRRKKVNFYKGLEESLRRTTPANYHPFAVLVRALEGLLP